MNNSGALGSHASRFPVEVCENIIDMLYSSTLLRDQIEHTRALRSCALVCRAWRTRSQRNLFYFVILHGTEAIRRLAVVLDNGPHLCHYVREVILVGRTLHSTTNSLSLFPVALQGKLPRLSDFTVAHVLEDEDWYPRMSESHPTKLLEHLPLHPRFPLFLSAFTTVTRLFVFDVTFRHFNDFLGMLSALHALQVLICVGLRCMALGPLPMYADQQTDVGGPRARPFASNLEALQLVSLLQYTRTTLTLF